MSVKDSDTSFKNDRVIPCYMISYDFKIPDGQGQGLIDVNVESLQQFFGTGVHIACVDERNTSISNLPNPIYRDKIFSNCYGPAFRDTHLPSPPRSKLVCMGAKFCKLCFKWQNSTGPKDKNLQLRFFFSSEMELHI